MEYVLSQEPSYDYSNSVGIRGRSILIRDVVFNI